MFKTPLIHSKGNVLSTILRERETSLACPSAYRKPSSWQHSSAPKPMQSTAACRGDASCGHASYGRDDACHDAYAPYAVDSGARTAKATGTVRGSLLLAMVPVRSEACRARSAVACHGMASVGRLVVLDLHDLAQMGCLGMKVVPQGRMVCWEQRSNP
jgi:hypothetical protein